MPLFSETDECGTDLPGVVAATLPLCPPVGLVDGSTGGAADGPDFVDSADDPDACPADDLVVSFSEDPAGGGTAATPADLSEGSFSDGPADLPDGSFSGDTAGGGTAVNTTDLPEGSFSAPVGGGTAADPEDCLEGSFSDDPVRSVVGGTLMTTSADRFSAGFRDVYLKGTYLGEAWRLLRPPEVLLVSLCDPVSLLRSMLPAAFKRGHLFQK